MVNNGVALPQVHPLLLAERAETCTIWLLRYTLHVTSVAPAPALKGKEDKSQPRTVSETNRCIVGLMDGQTTDKVDRQMLEFDFDDGKRSLVSVSAD